MSVIYKVIFQAENPYIEKWKRIQKERDLKTELIFWKATENMKELPDGYGKYYKTVKKCIQTTNKEAYEEMVKECSRTGLSLSEAMRYGLQALIEDLEG